MAGRRRIIALALGCLILFLIITTRKSSGSHPRDLHNSRFKDTEHRDKLHTILKEPPGKWDPVEDRFKDQNAGDKIPKELQDQLDAIARGALDMPEELLRRKPIRKEGQGDSKRLENLAKGQPEPEKKESGAGAGAGGSGAVVVEQQPEVLNEYDPAQGTLFI